ncbi:MAG: AMP-binding protein, partial [Verrucomicrobiae bacterium]|nr:AMP-binding protein [Verrucomicrobiae bacterium]
MSMGSANDFELRVPEHFNFALDVIDRWAAEAPERVALWCVGEGGVEKKLTFGELEAASRRAAGFFSSMGLDARDRALILMPRLPQWWVAMLGLIRLGVVPIPCTTLLTPKDIDYRIQTAGVKAFLSDGEGASKFAEIAPAPEGIIRIAAGCDRPGWASFDAGVAQASPEFEGPRTRGDDPGIIYFTSATTGHPKMVLHTQASYGLGHRITGGLWLDLGPKDVCWNLSDTGWAKAAWSSFFGPWQMGSCIFAVDSRGKFDAGATLKTLASHPISVWCAPPTALRLVVREDLSAFRPGALRHCVSAGEPLNPEVISTWKNATGITIYEAYGQTETVCLIGNFRSTGR